MKFHFSAFLTLVLASGLALCARAADSASAGASAHGASLDTAAFSVRFEDGWLVSWTNRRTGETLTFGKPDNAPTVAAPYQPGPWAIPAYGAPADSGAWSLAANAVGRDSLSLQQRLTVPLGDAQSVQWSLRLPLDVIDASFWPTGLTTRLISKDSRPPEGTIGKNDYFGGRTAILSGHQWRQRYYVIQGKQGGLLVYVDDPAMAHFNAIEMDAARFPREVTITHRSIAAPPWSHDYAGSKWMIVQYDGWLTEGADIYRRYVTQAFNVKPLSERPTAWVNDLVWTYVKPPWMSPPIPHAGDGQNENYSDHWKENQAMAEQWLKNLSQVLDPSKVLFYTTWWRYDAHDTMFPDHSVDPFFALMVGKARRMGFHVMLHFHNHLVQDKTTFYGRYVAKQNEWHLAANPDRPKMVGDPTGQVPWGVGFDFIRKRAMIQNDKEFGTSYSNRLGLPSKMSGYQMSPSYEGWRYMKVAEILSAIRSTGADGIHLDVPAVWPEGTERYGMNSQQGIREFYKLLRETLDENGLSHVAIATEATPGEAYMKYVDMGQLIRGTTTQSLLDGVVADTMIELQIGDDLDKAKAARDAFSRRQGMTAEQKKSMKFDVAAVSRRIGQMREFGEPNLDELVIAPYVRAYPHLGAISPSAGGNPKDPAAPVHNQMVQSLHVWATLQRGATFNSLGSLNMFMDTPPWDSTPRIVRARKELSASGVRKEGKIFTAFEYGEYALARWCQEMRPEFAPLMEWQRGDVLRLRLKNGKTLVGRRPSETLLELTVDGEVLAALDMVKGWSRNEDLVKKYGPPFLQGQLDSIDRTGR